MPSSSPVFITEVIQNIQKLEPMNILDVGIGFGKWGALCREYLDVWQGRINRSDWIHRIDGVEIFGDYIQDHQRHIYSSIFVDDIQNFADLIPPYDLIILGDVLEHIEKEAGKQLLEKLIGKSKKIILSIPIGPWPQDEMNGNKYEKHLSTWTSIDFVKYDVDYVSFKLVGSRELGLFIIDCGRE